jgi:hypothetical protein
MNAVVIFMLSPAYPPSTPSTRGQLPYRGCIDAKTYQGLHCSVESMSVVSAELWIGTFE